MKNRELIGKIVNIVKEQQADTRLSKKTVWYSIFNTAHKLIDRDLQNRRLWKQSNVWKPLCVEMQEIPAIQCSCVQIDNGCTVMRSRNKLPKIFVSSLGAAIYSVTTIDGSKELKLTSPISAVNNGKIKGVSDVYCFIEDDYLYVLKKKYGALIIKALFEEDPKKYACDYVEATNSNDCSNWLDEDVFIPQRLIDDISKIVEQELMGNKQIPLDTLNNKNANTTEK